MIAAIQTGWIPYAFSGAALALGIFNTYWSIRKSRRTLILESPLVLPIEDYHDASRDDPYVRFKIHNTGDKENRVMKAALLMSSGRVEDLYELKELGESVEPTKEKVLTLNASQVIGRSVGDGSYVVGLKVTDIGGRSYYQPLRRMRGEGAKPHFVATRIRLCLLFNLWRGKDQMNLRTFRMLNEIHTAAK